jgi:hypothetical protein
MQHTLDEEREMESGLTLAEEDALVAEAADKFPATFGLRAFPGKTFRINRRQSYVTGGKTIQLYVFLTDGRAFGKETPARLRKEVVDAPAPA